MFWCARQTVLLCPLQVEYAVISEQWIIFFIRSLCLCHFRVMLLMNCTACDYYPRLTFCPVSFDLQRVQQCHGRWYYLGSYDLCENQVPWTKPTGHLDTSATMPLEEDHQQYATFPFHLNIQKCPPLGTFPKRASGDRSNDRNQPLGFFNQTLNKTT